MELIPVTTTVLNSWRDAGTLITGIRSEIRYGRYEAELRVRFMSQSRKTKPVANVLNLGHTEAVKPIQFHPKALEFIRSQSTEIKRKIGEALRDVQKGISIGLPLSRPMSGVASGVRELRVKDEGSAVRIFYLVKMADAIFVFLGF